MTNSSALLHEIANSVAEDEPTTVVVVILRGNNMNAYASGTECDTAHQVLALGAAHQYILRSVTDGK